MDGIAVERRGPVALIEIDRPESLNAVTHAHAEYLTGQVRAAAGDRSCRAVVITGRGRAFCAGIDVKAVAALDARRSAVSEKAVDPVIEQFEGLHVRLGNLIRSIHSVPVPVIAAVNGHAVGAGFAIAAAADVRIASASAKFVDGFVARGISGCELGLSYFLPRIVGAGIAFEWMATGRQIDASEAHRAGLVSVVAPEGELVERALDLAQQFAANAPAAIAMTKEVMWANVDAASLDAALALESRTQVMVRSTEDAREARQAFLEKRRPQFGSGATARPLH